MSLFGTLLLQLNPSSTEGGSLGNFLAVISSLFMALTWFQAKKIRKSTDTVVYGRTVFFISSITIFVVVLFTKESIFSFDSGNFIWFLFLGFVPSILGHNLLNIRLSIFQLHVSSVVLGEPVLLSWGIYFLVKASLKLQRLVL